MTISPSPLPANEAPVDRPRKRVSYDWGSVVPGTWQRWLDLTTADVDDDEALRQCTRIRVAAKWHADHNGLQLQSRRQHKGRLLDLMFTTRD